MREATVRVWAVVLATIAACAPSTGCAGTRDEIRVYTDSIVDPGEFEIEAHFNSIPRPRTAVPAGGETRAVDGVILTPELSYGLTRTIELEVGLFWPFARTSDDTSFRISPEVRLKWMPSRGADDDDDDDDDSRWFYGAILEWSPRRVRPSDARSSVDLRPVLGWRSRRWLFAANLILEWPLGGSAPRSPEFSPAFKTVRTMSPGFGLGIEYHGELGRLNDRLPANQQLHTLYLTFDFAKPVNLHFGIGHGLNPQSGAWSIKGSVEIPLN